jgi:carbon storage regulator CsrA
MLVISRKKEQKIIVADEIEITILEIGRTRVRFGIKAPKSISIQTNLKDTPTLQESLQPTEMQRQASPLQGLPAASGLRKAR